MKLKSAPILLVLTLLFTCTSVMSNQRVGAEHINPDDIVNLQVDQLSDYWVSIPSPTKQYKKRPVWAPKGHGEWIQLTTIDYEGNEVERILISATPEGFITQAQLDAMPKIQYKAAVNNKNSAPVRFLESLKIVPKTTTKG